jgi:hypothetical protein
LALRDPKRRSAIFFVILLALAAWTLLALLVVTVAPLVEHPATALWTATLAAVVWLAPCIVLGLMTPVIKRSVQTPKQWGVVAFLAAGLTLAALIFEAGEPWQVVLFAAALILIATAILFQRGATMIEYWPLAAISVAVLGISASRLFQGTTRSALIAFHGTREIPLTVDKRDRYNFMTRDQRIALALCAAAVKSGPVPFAQVDFRGRACQTAKFWNSTNRFGEAPNTFTRISTGGLKRAITESKLRTTGACVRAGGTSTLCGTESNCLTSD